jgi:hypothetical protein
MKKSQRDKKLSLHKETVLHLDKDLDKVAGGGTSENGGMCPTRTDPSICSVCSAYC